VCGGSGCEEAVWEDEGVDDGDGDHRGLLMKLVELALELAVRFGGLGVDLMEGIVELEGLDEYPSTFGGTARIAIVGVTWLISQRSHDCQTPVSSCHLPDATVSSS